MSVAQVAAAVTAILVMTVIISNIASSERTRSYAKGAASTSSELMKRFEGGTLETFRQSGLLGLGLGAATQGIQHVSGGRRAIGWQEGGLAKLAVEIGLPGILLALGLGVALLSIGRRLTRIGDVAGTSQIGRCILFGLFVGNGANFAGSAQAYSDPVLTLITACFIGWLLASATLDERLAESLSPTGPLPIGLHMPNRAARFLAPPELRRPVRCASVPFEADFRGRSGHAACDYASHVLPLGTH